MCCVFHMHSDVYEMSWKTRVGAEVGVHHGINRKPSMVCDYMYLLYDTSIGVSLLDVEQVYYVPVMAVFSLSS